MKIEQIKAKVLETGKISPLINYTVRKGRGSVEIVTEDIDYLYKQLLEGATKLFPPLSIQQQQFRLLHLVRSITNLWLIQQ